MALSLKQIHDRILHFRNTWRALAPGHSFLDITPEKFERETADSLRLREEIRRLEARLIALRVERDRADRKAMALMERLACAVRVEPGYGSDCPFYAALGYIPHSQWKTGKVPRRKRRSSQ